MTEKGNDILRFITLLIGVLSACLFLIFLFRYARLVTLGQPSLAIGGTLVAMMATGGLYAKMSTLQRLLRGLGRGLAEEDRLGLERIVIFLSMSGMIAIILLTTLCILAGLNIHILLKN